MRHLHVLGKDLIDRVELRHEHAVLAEFEQFVVAEHIEQEHRIGGCAMPCIVVNLAEQILGITIPNPPEVICKFT